MSAIAADSPQKQRKSQEGGSTKRGRRTFESEIGILTGPNVSHLRQNPKWDWKWTVVTVEKGQ